MSRHTRREVIGLGVAGALAGAAPAAALPPGTGTLWQLLAIERQMVVGYSSAIARELTRSETTRLLRRLLAEEQRHGSAIEVALRRIGADVPSPTQFVARDIDAADSEPLLLEILLETEQVAVAAGFGAAQDLTRPDQLRLVADALSDHGRHLTALRLALGHPALGPAFETGGP